MSSGLNKVMVLGNLGRDPEMKTAGKTSVLKLSIAVSERYKDNNGEWKDKTEWVSASLWGTRAEALSRILSKGDKIFVEGSLRTTSSEKDGQKRYYTEVNVSNIILCGGGKHEKDEQAASPKRTVKPVDIEDAVKNDPFSGDDDIPF